MATSCDDLRPLTEQTEAARVVVELWRDARAVTSRDRSRAVLEERRLRRRTVLRQQRLRVVALLARIAARDAESQASQRETVGVRERLREDPSSPLLVVVDLDVREVLGAASVVRAVQVRDLVREAVFEQVAGDLQTDVAVRYELRRVRTLDEPDVVGGLQALEADGCLELAAP